MLIETDVSTLAWLAVRRSWSGTPWDYVRGIISEALGIHLAKQQAPAKTSVYARQVCRVLNAARVRYWEKRDKVAKQQ